MNLRTLLKKCNMYNFFAISFHNIIFYHSNYIWLCNVWSTKHFNRHSSEIQFLLFISNFPPYLLASSSHDYFLHSSMSLFFYNEGIKRKKNNKLINILGSSNSGIIVFFVRYIHRYDIKLLLILLNFFLLDLI